MRDIAEDVATGISSGLDKAYVYTESGIINKSLEEDLLRKLIIGGEINRYCLQPTSGKKIIYITPDIKIQEYPNIQKALLPYKEPLKKRREAANGKIPWYSLNWPRRKKLFEQPKILIRQTADRILACLDTDQWYCLKSGIIVQLPSEAKLKYEYLLGILNSRLIKYLYDDLVGEQSRVFPEVKPVQLFKLPIRNIDFSNPSDVGQHNRMVSLVNQMLTLHRQLNAAQMPQDRELIKRYIDTIDQQIDCLVYTLYGLNDEERMVVENSS